MAYCDAQATSEMGQSRRLSDVGMSVSPRLRTYRCEADNRRFGAIGGHRRSFFLSELLCQFGGLLFAGVDHIDSTTIPRVFELKRHYFPDTDES